MKLLNQIAIIVLLFLVNSCASVPPEFLTSMEKERDGISLLKKRHTQAVTELTQNWYDERMARLMSIKQIEINKITLSIKDPQTNQNIDVLHKEKLQKIEAQLNQQKIMVDKIRALLIAGYSDIENWDKLTKIHAMNLDMTRSLLELNEAQRKLYTEIVGDNIPFPTDFINEETNKLIDKTR